MSVGSGDLVEVEDVETKPDDGNSDALHDIADKAKDLVVETDFLPCSELPIFLGDAGFAETGGNDNQHDADQNDDAGEQGEEHERSSL